MISDLRKKKYKHVFDTYMDLDKNGVIDIRDIALLIDKICRFKGWKAGSPEYVEVQHIWYEIFYEMLRDVKLDKYDSIDLDLWMEMWDGYKNNPSLGLKWQNKIENFCFKLVKDPKLNSWSAKTFVPIVAEFGIDDSEAERAFKKAAQGKDEILAADYTKLFMQLFTSDDLNAPGNYISGKESF